MKYFRLGIIMSLFLLGLARSVEWAVARERPYFKIAYDAKSDICKPIAHLYTSLLVKMLASKESGAALTAFSATHPKSFERIGLMPFASTSRPQTDSYIIFDEIETFPLRKKSQSTFYGIRVNDSFRGNSPSTTVDILGSNPESNDNLSQPKILQVLSRHDLVLSQKSSDGKSGAYFLPHWPRISELKNSFLQREIHPDGQSKQAFPVLEDAWLGALVRAFETSSGKIILIMDQYTTKYEVRELSPLLGQAITIVFSYEPNRLKEVCYLAAGPSLLTKSLIH